MKIFCQQCKKSFDTSNKKRKYCSQSCYYKFKEGKPAYPNILNKRGIKPRIKRVEIECLHCKKIYLQYPVLAEPGKRNSSKYCSKLCQNRHQSQPGEKHHSWKGGISKTSAKRWLLKNGDRKRYLNLRRANFKKQIVGYHTFEEWVELKTKYNNKCLCCGKGEPEIRLSEDHIIPISMGGDNYITNIQPLCRSCNSKKHTKTINYVVI